MKRQTESGSVKAPPSLSLNISLSPLGSRLAILLVVFVLVWLLLSLFGQPIKNLEERVGALGWSMSFFASGTESESASPVEERIVIVAIDEESLQQVGAWPWSRQTLADLSNRLQEYGAASQVFDLVFPESRPGDDLLNRALISNQAIVGQIPILDLEQKAIRTGVLSGAMSSGCYPLAPKARGYLANAPSVMTQGAQAVASGHITPHISNDGSVRFQAPVVCADGKAYPSLALSLMLHNLNIDRLVYQETSFHNPASLLEPSGRLVAPDYPLLSIPVDNNGLMRVNYEHSPERFIYVSAADVLAGRVDPDLLNNRWVLVGATAFGMGDLVPSPYSGLTPGIEIQARLVVSMLDQSIPYTPSGLWLYRVLSLVMIFSALLVLATRSADHRHGFSRAIFMSSPLLIPGIALIIHTGALNYQLWLGWSEQAILGCASALSLLVLEYLRNRHEKQRLFDNLSSYLPEDIASAIAFHQPSGQLKAEQMSCVVLSADLRNFSAFQRNSSPENTVQLLHGFFTLASHILEKHQGTLFELKADALLAVWPLETDDDRKGVPIRNAWAAAAEIQQQIQPMLARALADESEPLGLGIGLAAGDVIQGQLGSERNRTAIILGDAVTRALGLQHMTEELAYPTLCSTEIRHYLADTEVQDIGRFLLPGSLRPKTLFAPDSASLSRQVPGVFSEQDADETDGSVTDSMYKASTGIAQLSDYRTFKSSAAGKTK